MAWAAGLCWVIGRMVDSAEQRLEALLQPAVADCGCHVWGIELQRGRGGAHLRVYIDKPGGVSVGDCERVSDEIASLIDLDGGIESSYQLEVSSPGLDRILFRADQYQSHVGQRIDLRLHLPIEGRRRFVGLLAGVEEDQAVVQIDDDEYLFPIEQVQRARIVPQFDQVATRKQQGQLA